jgi:thiol-disulfide isomerase/thioredoxin
MRTPRETNVCSHFISVALCTVVVFVLACSPRAPEPSQGAYRATLKLPGGDASFGLRIAREGNTYVLVLLNGSERTEVRNVEIREGELRATFPGYENRLRADIDGRALRGEVTLIKAGGREQVIPFEAQLGNAPRFSSDIQAPTTNVTGRWALVLTDEEGERTDAVAMFEQDQNRVTGTVMTPTGDHRYLEGQISGDDLKLSTFAGGLAYLYHLRLVGQATLQGEYWQGLTWHEKVSGQRNDDATLSRAQIKTSVASDTPLSFTFPDVGGKNLSLSDERFRGKVVLVTIGGTWCPNCHDEARFLVPFYREYRDKGFEVIGLMFERHGDFDKAAAAVRGYERDLGIEFPLLVAGVAENNDAANKLPALSGVYGYPTAILIDKQGKIRDIHTGFSGPATGKFYEEYTAEFRNKVDALLAE